MAVSGLTNGVTDVAAGSEYSLAVKNGNVYAWGEGEAGALGDGTFLNRSTPVQIDPGHLTNVVAVAAGGYSSYALLFRWQPLGLGR